MTSKYLTTDELAQELRTPVDTIRYWRYAGKGPRSLKVGRRVLYDPADVEAWIAERRAAADSAAR